MLPHGECDILQAGTCRGTGGGRKVPKKKWKRPKLVILTRGRPGERVLETCKLHLISGTPDGIDTQCYTWVVDTCAYCHDDVGS